MTVQYIYIYNGYSKELVADILMTVQYIYIYNGYRNELVADILMTVQYIYIYIYIYIMDIGRN